MGRTKHKQGFTIVELLIVIVVIGILAAITMVAYNGVQSRARTVTLQVDTRAAMQQLNLFALNNGDAYPTGVTTCPAAGSAMCLTPSGSNAQTYVYDNTVSPRSFCYSSKTTSGESYYVDSSNSVLPGSCDTQSCYLIAQSNGSHGSGIYWIKPSGSASSQRVYCDMVTSGGGWTLLVTNVGGGLDWNSTTVKSLNSVQPSITSQYSILNKADSIKSNIGGKLRYRIDATSAGLWGGVWEAPFANTFTGTTVVNNATNIEQYGTWTIDTTLNSTDAVTNVMPWLSTGTKLLSTWGDAGSWYGTIVTGSTGWNAAPFISPEHDKPQVIWYWVR